MSYSNNYISTNDDQDAQELQELHMTIIIK